MMHLAADRFQSLMVAGGHRWPAGTMSPSSGGFRKTLDELDPSEGELIDTFNDGAFSEINATKGWVIGRFAVPEIVGGSFWLALTVVKGHVAMVDEGPLYLHVKRVDPMTHRLMS